MAAASAPASVSFAGDGSAQYEKMFEAVSVSWGKIADKCALPAGGAGIKLLDVGAGPGEPACHLAKRFPAAQITCTDLEPDMVAKARARAARLGVSNVTCAVANAEKLPFPAASFDVVTANMVLMLVADAQAMLREAARVLKPRGRLIVTVWKENGVIEVAGPAMAKVRPDLPAVLPPPLSMKADGAVEAALAAAGFAVASAERYNFSVPLGVEESVKKASLFFVRSKLSRVDKKDRKQVTREYQEVALAEMRARGWEGSDGRFRYPGAHQIVEAVKAADARL